MAIAVDDDGPGLAEGMREAGLQRGARADENLDRSPLGGLRARLDLPAG